MDVASRFRRQRNQARSVPAVSEVGDQVIEHERKLAMVAKTKEMVWSKAIDAPHGFMATSLEVLAGICNGCGAGNAKFDFVPDSIYGLCICDACNVHDWGYHTGRSRHDKQEADQLFLTNVMQLIEHNSANALMRMLRRRRALKYYEAVVAFGDDAFFAGKLVC